MNEKPINKNMNFLFEKFFLKKFYKGEYSPNHIAVKIESNETRNRMFFSLSLTVVIVEDSPTKN